MRVHARTWTCWMNLNFYIRRRDVLSAANGGFDLGQLENHLLPKATQLPFARERRRRH